MTFIAASDEETKNLFQLLYPLRNDFSEWQKFSLKKITSSIGPSVED